MHHGHSSLSDDGGDTEEMKLAKLVAFTTKDLYIGKTVKTKFPYKDASSRTKILPRHVADSIPFTSEGLDYILQLVGIQQGSYEAKAMETTLAGCEARSITGETRYCATSLESMLDFARDTFGWDKKFKVVSTITHLEKTTGDDSLAKNYTILEYQEIAGGSNKVACHLLSYPYAVFGCHCVQDTKAFRVLLGGEDGLTRVEAVSLCHMDTSEWKHEHPLLRALGLEPGTAPVCHFFPSDDLVIIPSLGA